MKIHQTIIAAAVLAVTSLTASAAPKDWIGKQLPDLKVTYLAATPDLKGKPAIVEFWATWCPPCRASIPHLNELHKKFKDKGLAVVGITDEDKQTVTKFQKGVPMDYSVAMDKGGKLSKDFGIRGIPHAFIVGKDGKIVWEGHPMTMKEADIEKVLQ